ncbi:hypothetical protein VKT23_006274 [Stygiomarasmius scandens]|uniref:Uncharacterized protein n=1 Tax=Marasmiellus scandens TaxID=2682957 RepID=A0ABR1JMD3_9AGAR
MTQPAAQGQLYFAGEALSTCHAWVAGALNSVIRAIDQFLLVYKSNESDKKVIHKFHEQWGKPWGESEYWTKEQLDNQLALGLARSGVF